MIFNFFKGKSEYTKNILTLVTGTGIAQLVPLAVSPIVTRLYTPEDFGMIALYMSIVSILVVLSSGRYEMAIMLPKNDSDVSGILRLIALLTLCVSFLLLIIICFFANEIAIFLGSEELSSWLYLIPVSIILTVMYQSLNYLAIRASKFKLLASNKVIASTSNASLQLGVGYTLNTPWGLLLGHLASLSFCLYILLKRKTIRLFFSLSRGDVKSSAREYANFPKYDMPAILVNLSANQLPLVVLGKFFGLGVLGAYSFMYKILMMPVGLISNSVLDVFKQKATSDYNRFGNCRGVYFSTFKHLILISGPIFIVFFIFSPDLFSFIFGSEWKEAGEFARIMAPMFFFKFVTSPLSYTLFVTGKQKQNLKGQVAILFVSLMAVLAGLYFDDVFIFLVSLSFLNSLIYIFYLFFSYRCSLGDVAHD